MDFDLVKKEKRNLKEYTFNSPEPTSDGWLRFSVSHGGGVIGSLTVAAKPIARPGHAYDGYHKIGKADVHPYHRGNGVYGKMLQLAAAHVKGMGSRGLVSPGEWREDAATKAWERLASKVKAVKRRPGHEPENPDFFLSEKEHVEALDSESSAENVEHEWTIEFKRWFAERSASKVMSKSDSLWDLVGGNLKNAHTRADEEIATQMSGVSAQISPEFKAAKWLANGKDVSEDDIRTALVIYDHDFELAALYAYGLPRNKHFLTMLRATMAMSTPELSKAEIDVAALPRVFKPVMPDGKDVAEALQRASVAQQLRAIQLGGKHSKGTALATDPKTGKKWLLKPGSGQLSPARGVREELASQSRREVAFYKIAKIAGVEEFFPEAYLIDVDGVEVAVMELLSTQYQSLDKSRRKLGVDPRRLFEAYRKNGSIFKWATLDWVLGNADRHANNIMIHGDEVKLIDHGTTFAGPSFNPAADLKKSFIPFYLRVWSRFNFNQLQPSDRMAQMPTMDREMEKKFGEWVETLPEDKFRETMAQYGINPEPSLARLRDLKSAKPELRARRLMVLWSGVLQTQSQG